MEKYTMFLCRYRHRYRYVGIYTHTYAYMHICMHICMYAYMYDYAYIPKMTHLYNNLPVLLYNSVILNAPQRRRHSSKLYSEETVMLTNDYIWKCGYTISWLRLKTLHSAFNYSVNMHFLGIS